MNKENPDWYNEDYWRIADAVFFLENTVGHLRWSVSALARHTKYQRTLLYYHFGKNKKTILANCLTVVANEFYGLSAQRISLVMQGKGTECIFLSRKMFQLYPNYLIFYTRWRHRDSVLRVQLMEIELTYQNKLRWIFPELNEKDIGSLHAILQGLVTAPFLSDESFAGGLKQIFGGPMFSHLKMKSPKKPPVFIADRLNSSFV